MAINSASFAGREFQATILRSRGFHPKTGARSGGIANPQQVQLSAGTILIRTYQTSAGMAGEWWLTPAEVIRIYEYFAREGEAFTDGRQNGKGILQAVLAVRHEWGGQSPQHLGLVAVIKLKQTFEAMYGEGDVAPDNSQKSVLKPIRLTYDGGLQRGVYQIFVPNLQNHADAFDVLERDCPADMDLIRIAKGCGASPLAFEAP